MQRCQTRISIICSYEQITNEKKRRLKSWQDQKKTANKKVTRKATAKKVALKTKAKAKPTTKAKKTNQSTALQLPSSSLKSIIRRPDPNLPPSPHLVDEITHDLLTIIELVEEYAANLHALDRCRKAKGFLAWSFAKHKPLQKNILSCQIKKTIKTTVSPLANLPCYTA